jgi:hypothetical protein
VDPWPVVGVVGGSGGVGASTFAAVLALGAARATRGPAVLIDLDPIGGGIDVLLGVQSIPGLRWSGVSGAGSPLLAESLGFQHQGSDRNTAGPVDRRVFRLWAARRRRRRPNAVTPVKGAFAECPQWDSVAVLSADTPSLPPPEVASRVVDRARAGSPVVFDLSRCPSVTRDVVLGRCGLIVLVAHGRGRAIAGARSVRKPLRDLPVGLVVRGGGPIGPRRASGLLSARLRGQIASYDNLVDPIGPGIVPPSMTELASRLIEGLM